MKHSPMLREAFSNKLAALKLEVGYGPTDLLEAHRAFALRYETQALAGYRPDARQADVTRRLRIGYVSPDCHGALPAFIRPVLLSHDFSKFEITCYFNNPQPEESDAAIAAKVRRRVMVGQSDEQVASQIRADGIDVLIDIAGHTGRNRLGVFMLRPAPIQVSWLDYLGTTGLDCIDYRITDEWADPRGITDANHTEMLVRLPYAQWCYQPAADAPPVSPLPALGAQSICFGSLNNSSKLTEATLFLWAKLLVPNCINY